MVWSNFSLLKNFPVDHLVNPVSSSIILLESFSYQQKRMVFYLSLRDTKSSQVLSTLLSNLGAFKNPVVSIVSALSPISKSSSLFTNIWCLYQEHQLQLIKSSLSCSIFFQFPIKVKVIILLLAFFQFYSVFSRNSKVHNSASSLFTSGRLAEIR